MTSRRPTAGRARLRADHPAVAWIVAGSVAVVAAMAMAMSFAGLAGVVAWTGLPGWAAWTLPIALDGGMLAFTLAAFARRAEGRSTTYPWAMVVVATTASAAANACHVVLPTLDGFRGAQVWVGASLMAFTPVWAALAAHQVADMVAPARPEAAVRRTTPAIAPAPGSTPTAPVVAAPTPAAVAPAPARASRASGPDRAALQAEVTRLIANGMSRSQVAATTGVALSTVKRWAAAAPEGAAV